jgi:hypothetical protein
MGQGIPQVPIGELDKVLRSYTLGKIEVKDVIYQTIALIAGSDDLQRKILRSSETGVLNVCSARFADILHVTATGAAFDWHGDYLPTTECIVIGHPDNSGLVWARCDKAATANNAYPCGAGTGLGMPVDNLKNLHLHIVESGDVAIVMFTR